MPGIRCSLLSAVSSRSAPSSLFVAGSVFAMLVGCNGQTAFVEQSRALDAQVQVAAADADALGKRRNTVNPELPIARDGELGNQSGGNSGRGSASIEPDVLGNQSSGNSGGGSPPIEPDVLGNGIDEKNRAHAGDVSGAVGSDPAQQGGEPTVPPQAQVPPQGPVPPQAQVPPQVPVPPQAQVPPQVPAQPQPRAGDVVQVQLAQPRAQVDILWVVDSSGSMAWAQNKLKSNFESFAQKLKNTRIDFQVGVTSLDVCKVDDTTGIAVPDALCPNATYIPSGSKIGGKIVGPLRGNLQADPSTKQSILRDTGDFVQAFQRTALLGTKGSAFEHGLWAAKLAVEKALNPNGENKGFIRPNASLSVVVLSDEEDDSVQMWCEDGYGRTSTTADGKKDLTLCQDGGRSPFLDAFGISPYALMKTAKGLPITTHKYTADAFKAWASTSAVKGEGNFRVSAITGLRGNDGNINCSLSSGGPEESGTNYIKAAQLTGGSVENICSDDWSSVLGNIGQNTVELATRVSLPAGKIPFAGTLEVKVDGDLLSSSQYSYDKTLHAVIFKTPPAMGAEIVVSYRDTLVD